MVKEFTALFHSCKETQPFVLFFTGGRKMLVANLLLSVLFISGVRAKCDKIAALTVTAPKEMVAISGSCLQIPCSFNIPETHTFDGSRSTFGVWIKNDSRFAQNLNNVIFNSSIMGNGYPMVFTGNLSEGNCTTLFSSLLPDYTNTYFFRVENRPFEATASCDPLNITVQDSPPNPRIEISGVLKENEPITITCSAVAPCPHFPPNLFWNLHNSPNKLEKNTDGTLTTKIQKSMTLTDKSDGLSITCVARYHVNESWQTAKKETTLRVSYAPKQTSVSISPPGLLSAGSWVSLKCSSRAKPPVRNFTWFRISQGGNRLVTKVSEGPVYSFNVTDGEVYYCMATNDLGEHASSKIHLTFKGAEQSSVSLGGIVGGIIVVMILIGGVVAAWWFKSKRPASQHLQAQRESPIQGSARPPQTEEIHYGQIDFSGCRQEPTSASPLDSKQHQRTLYAQVKVCRVENSSTQSPQNPESVYAEVKK